MKDEDKLGPSFRGDPDLGKKIGHETRFGGPRANPNGPSLAIQQKIMSELNKQFTDEKAAALVASGIGEAMTKHPQLKELLDRVLGPVKQQMEVDVKPHVVLDE